MNKLIKALFFVQEWKPYYRVLSEEEQKKPLEDYCRYAHSYYLVPIPKNKWAADTFVLDKKGKCYAFFEYMDCKKNKAVIASKSIEDHSLRVDICYEFDGHTSYPAVFMLKEHFFMIPETVYSNSVNLLQLDENSNKWVFKKRLCKGRFPDTTPFVYNNQLYIYRYLVSDSSKNSLLVSKLDDKSFEIIDSKIVCDYPNWQGRPAGNIIVENERILRPTQFNKNFYGERIDFYDVNLSDASESFSFSFSKRNIAISERGNVIGTHTFNRCGKYEIIDVLFLKFSPFKLLKSLFKRIGLFGFSNYEKRRKYLYKNENK